MAIPQFLFASQLMTTGLLCNSNVVWITFDGATDFGYLLSLFEGLPVCQVEFWERLGWYFRNWYDLKEMKRELHNGGLERTIQYCGLRRIGTMH